MKIALRYYVFLLFLLSACNAGEKQNASEASIPDTFSGKVVSIKDGDTIEVLYEEHAYRVRLADIDCPESGQPFGQKAKQYTSSLCFGQIVKVEGGKRDQYKRILGTVFLPDGKVLNEELLKAGFAWHYVQYSEKPEYGQLEQEARDAGLGLWSAKDAVEPWRYRKNHKAHSTQQPS